MVAIQLLVLTLASLALGNPLGRRSMKVHESRREAPSSFMKRGAAPTESVLKLRIALAQNDPDGLTKALMDVSDPASPSYGQHLTKEEVRLRRFVPKMRLKFMIFLRSKPS